MRSRMFIGALVAVLLMPLLCLAQGPRATNVINSLQNDTTTGTTLNGLAKIVPGPNGLGKLVKATASDTGIDLYVVIAAAGVAGEAVYVVSGETACVFDQTNASGMAGKYVVVSPSAAPQCRVLTSAPANGFVVGKMIDDTTTAGQLARLNAGNQPYLPGGTPSGITSVGLSMPAEFSVANSPVSSGAGTITVTEATQTANTIYAGPASGGAAAPGFRTLVAADVPGAPPSGTAGGDLSGTYPNPTVAKAGGAFALAGESTPAALSGQANDYNLCTTSTCFITGGAADRLLTGLAAPAATGALQEICNAGTSNALILPNKSTASAAANRFVFTANAAGVVGDDVTIGPQQCFLLRYHTALPGWRPAVSTALDAQKIRVFGAITGDPDTASPALGTGNTTPDGWTNDYGRPARIETFNCRADAAGLVVRAILKGGSATSILTGDCTCGNGVFVACTVQATRPLVQPFNADGFTCATGSCSVDFLPISNPNGARYVVMKGRAYLQ